MPLQDKSNPLLVALFVFTAYRQNSALGLEITMWFNIWIFISELTREVLNALAIQVSTVTKTSMKTFTCSPWHYKYFQFRSSNAAAPCMDLSLRTKLISKSRSFEHTVLSSWFLKCFLSFQPQHLISHLLVFLYKECMHSVHMDSEVRRASLTVVNGTVAICRGRTCPRDLVRNHVTQQYMRELHVITR